MVRHTHEVLTALDDVVSLAKDAETGQRGYVITGDHRYLEPHTVATIRIHDRLRDIDRLTRDNPDQQTHIPALKSHLDAKLQEMTEGIVLRREQGFEAARAAVVTDRGKHEMDAIRAHVEAMEQTERALRTWRLAEMDDAYRVAIGSGILSGLLGALLSVVVTYLVRRAVFTRRRQEWLQFGQIGLAAAVAGDQRIEPLGEKVFKFLAEYLDAHAGAFFVKDGGIFRRVATYGVPPRERNAHGV